MLKDTRTLLVEDEPQVSKLFSLMLAQENGIVDPVSSVSEGLRLLGLNSYDVIVLDLYLSDSKGPTTVSKFQEAFPNIPIVAVTGMLFPELEKEALLLGAQEVLHKDANVKAIDLTTAVVHAIERHKVRKTFAPLTIILDKAKAVVDEMQKLTEEHRVMTQK